MPDEEPSAPEIIAFAEAIGRMLARQDHAADEAAKVAARSPGVAAGSPPRVPRP